MKAPRLMMRGQRKGNGMAAVMTSEPHLLLVDDEPSIHEPLADYLQSNNYRVTVAENAVQARKVLERGGIDLILLDIMMPGEDGLSLTRTIRVQSTLPIILLTAKSEDTDRIIGLEMGADDYVSKPFNPRELLARIKAVLRRAEPAPDKKDTETFRFEAFTLDVAARSLFRGEEEEISLTGGEYTLLYTLVERAGRVLNRDQLLDMTQGREAHVFDRSIDNQISRLRKKIEEDPKNPALIKTVRGGGYVFAGKVSKS